MRSFNTHGAGQNDGWVSVRRVGDKLEQDGTATFFKGYMLDPVPGEQRSDGVYIRWTWTGSHLEVETCETGFLPVFYYFDRNRVVVGTSLKDLFQHGGITPSLDYTSLSIFLRLGFFIGNRTPFKNVQVLGPNGRLIWGRGRQQVEARYPVLSKSLLSRDEAMEAYCDSFRIAMERINKLLKEEFSVPLSGGRDSRHIALELYRMGRVPKFALTARHIPPRSDEDARIAEILCQHFGWNHLVVPQPSNRLGSELDHLELTDLLSFEHGWTVAIKQELARHGITQVFDGVGGDVLSAALFQDEKAVELCESGDLTACATHIMGRWRSLGGTSSLTQTCGAKLLPVSDEASAVAALEEELKEHIHQPFPLKSFYFWNRSRRGTNLLPFKVLSDITAFCPYISREVRELLLSLPHEITADATFHTDTIKLADKIVGNLPYEDKNSPLSHASGWSIRRYAAALLCASLTGYRTSTWNSTFVLSRSAKAALIGSQDHLTWWKPSRAIYLRQLGKLIEGTGLNEL